MAHSHNLYGYTPSLAANLIFALLMGVSCVIHTGLSIWVRAWSFGITFFCGTLLELIGYIARVLSHFDDHNRNAYIAQTTVITIAPIFIMAGIYYILAQLVMIYGSRFSMIRPLRYSIIFVTSDVLSLLIQGAGGAVASSANTSKGVKFGKNLVVAGLAFQVISMVLFFLIFSVFLYRIKFWSVKKQQALEHSFNPLHRNIRKLKMFKYFPFVLLIATTLVFIRCVFRLVELCQGWGGYLMVHEVYVIVLDGLMIVLCILILIPFHPALVYARYTKINVRSEFKAEREGFDEHDEQQSTSIGGEEGKD